MKNKKRHYPDKPQNNYGGNYNCLQYDKRIDGTEWCHDEGNSDWSEFIKWSQCDENGKLKCKGNRHNCLKLRQKWLASLSDKEKSKYL
jgi:hypothetical protein